LAEVTKRKHRLARIAAPFHLTQIIYLGDGEYGISMPNPGVKN
jgi:hypothetical protein